MAKKQALIQINKCISQCDENFLSLLCAGATEQSAGAFPDKKFKMSTAAVNDFAGAYDSEGSGVFPNQQMTSISLLCRFNQW